MYFKKSKTVDGLSLRKIFFEFTTWRVVCFVFFVFAFVFFFVLWVSLAFFRLAALRTNTRSDHFFPSKWGFFHKLDKSFFSQGKKGKLLARITTLHSHAEFVHSHADFVCCYSHAFDQRTSTAPKTTNHHFIQKNQTSNRETLLLEHKFAFSSRLEKKIDIFHLLPLLRRSKTH